MLGRPPSPTVGASWLIRTISLIKAAYCGIHDYLKVVKLISYCDIFWQKRRHAFLSILIFTVLCFCLWSLFSGLVVRPCCIQLALVKSFCSLFCPSLFLRMILMVLAMTATAAHPPKPAEPWLANAGWAQG